jgi:hypothetical protein
MSRKGKIAPAEKVKAVEDVLAGMSGCNRNS